MDSRIQLITNLKDCLSSRNSVVQLTCPESEQEEPFPEDIEYFLIRKQIVESTFLRNANRHVKIRLHKWLDYLDKIKSNKVWIKSRNKYIKLLNLMCYCECLIHPYNGLPPEGELPTLRKHQINKIIDQVQHFVKNNVPSYKKQGQSTETYYPEDISQKYQSFYSRESQVNKRLQTYPENLTADDTETETVPLKNLESRSRSNTETCDDSGTLPLSNRYWKKNKQNNELCQEPTPTFHKNDATFRKTNSSLSIERPQKSKVPQRGSKQASIQKKNAKVKKRFPHDNEEEKQNKNVSKTLALPPKYKSRVPEESKLVKQRISAIPKEYWQSLSNSEVHTPKYLSNYSSQQIAIQEQSVQIVSFRGEKQGESCICTGGKFGDSWLGQLLNKIIS